MIQGIVLHPQLEWHFQRLVDSVQKQLDSVSSHVQLQGIVEPTITAKLIFVLTHRALRTDLKTLMKHIPDKQKTVVVLASDTDVRQPEEEVITEMKRRNNVILLLSTTLAGEPLASDKDMEALASIITQDTT